MRDGGTEREIGRGGGGGGEGLGGKGTERGREGGAVVSENERGSRQ